MKPTIKSQKILQQKLDKAVFMFERKVRKDKRLGTGLFLMHSDQLGFHRKVAAHHDPSVAVDPRQPFHIASIGKTFTSAIIAMLYEKGMLDYDDFLCDHLPVEVMKNLHVNKGRDYSSSIRVRQLLNHTSGMADYYLDKDASGVSLLDLMISEPGRFWTPMDTLDWTKTHLTPKFAPGRGFHYSDANYMLLGLLIEKITGMEYHEALAEMIFRPLGMQNSYLIFYSEPETPVEHPLGKFNYMGLDLYKAKSVSMSWASGGIVSTLEDMLRFMQGLVHHRLMRPETRETMNDWAKMAFNLRYGYGIMKFHFPGMSRKYDIWGHSGSIGAVCYYNPAMDIYTIGTFHKNGYQVQPVIFIVNVLRKIRRAVRF